MKTCTSCREEKPIERFHRARDGRREARCATCRLGVKKQRYLERKSGIRPIVTPIIQVCSKCKIEKPATAYQRSFHHDTGITTSCGDCIAESRRLKNFRLTPGQYDAMLAEQEHVCAICQQPESAMATGGKGVRGLAVDHDHRSGMVRGLLCGNCNKGLGNFQDDPEILRAALAYLAAHDAVALEVI